jgi:hypothetical protein
MDLFDERLRELQNTADTWFGACGGSKESAAMVETAFLMAAADGQISAVEQQQLVATIASVTGDHFGMERLTGLVEQLLEVLQLDGWEARVANVARALRTTVSRRNAYRLAAGVSFIDHQIHQDEMQLFGMLAEAFAIPPEEASAILAEVRDMIFGPQEEPILLGRRR